jgi:hypothetical protein
MSNDEFRHGGTPFTAAAAVETQAARVVRGNGLRAGVWR